MQTYAMLDITVTADFVKTFELLISDEMAKMKVPGLAIAILKDNEIIYEQGFGARDLDNNLPADIDTLFGIASDTKSFICVAILQLMEQGKLDIDDPVSKYVPLTLGLETDPIKIRHLMSHSSGMPDLSGGDLYYTLQSRGLQVPSYLPLTPFTSERDFYRHVNAGEEYVTAKPGERFYYNNNGFQMLGDIIEKVSGLAMDDYIRVNILDKLEMNRSTLNPEDFKNDDNTAQGYHNISAGGDGKTKLSKISYYSNNVRNNMKAAGGMFTSVRERVNYAMMHLHGGMYKGEQILGKQFLEMMHTPQLNPDGIGAKNLSDGTGYGKSNYGFGLFTADNYFGYKLLSHGGNFIGCTSDFLLVPELKLGIVAAANMVSGPRSIIYTALGLLLGKDAKTEIPFLVHRAHLKSLTGVYEAYKGIQIKILQKGTNLFIEPLEPAAFSGPPAPLFPSNDDLQCMSYAILFMEGNRLNVEFERDTKKQLWLHVERTKAKKIKDL